VFLQVGLALVMMEAGVYTHIVTVLSWYANMGIAWIGAVASDLLINKRWLKLSPPQVEFRRAHLFNVNPVGFGSMLVAAGVAITASYHVFGTTAAALAPFFALVLAIVLPPVVAAATRGRWYIARGSSLPEGEIVCAVCDHAYDAEDMAVCPFHEGAICSLCCSTEGSCHDRCKTSAWRPVGDSGPVMLGLPRPIAAAVPREGVLEAEA
jgi:hypothetical protein